MTNVSEYAFLLIGVIVGLAIMVVVLLAWLVIHKRWVENQTLKDEESGKKSKG